MAKAETPVVEVEVEAPVVPAAAPVESPSGFQLVDNTNEAEDTDAPAATTEVSLGNGFVLVSYS